MRLAASVLPSLKGVKVPSYDRKALRPGIVHFGLGNFHRAHMAAYMEDLFSKAENFETTKQWGIVGAGIMSFDYDKRVLLEPQDWLQVLVERDASSVNARVIGSMIDFLPVEVEPIQEALKNPDIKIVSLTVTEGGYFLSDGKFDTTKPQIQHDIQNPDKPETIFGIIVKALRLRKESGQVPFTVMSCDNIPHNGKVVKSVVVGLAQNIDPELSKWIESNVSFPNSMVDRITPATSDEQRAYIKEHYDGLEDASPIFCEPFRQWVLEDNFSAGRPPLEVLENVKFVPDVTPYEFMKIRTLNGGHASLCYPGALLGLNFVNNCMEHPTISMFLDALQRSEIIPTVGTVPDTDTTEYWKIIANRFSNPTLNDTLTRICFDGASRQPKFIVPVIQDNLDAGRSVDGLALVSAMWCRYCQGTTESGQAVPPNDPQWDRLQEIALNIKSGKDKPVVWLTSLQDVYGTLGTNAKFVESFTKAHEAIQSKGVEETLKEYITANVASA